MPEYRRYFVPGGTYFFTIVTCRRRPILTTELGLQCLGDALRDIQEKRPFEIVAIVLLPDHWHTVWTLPPGDDDYSTRLKLIKEEFTEKWLAAGGAEVPVSASRRKKGERGIWQRRFYEHTCDDAEDLKKCVDYTHWNPKKHGHVHRVSAC